MKMTLGSGTISSYSLYTKNCSLGQWPYRIPVNNLQDVQLYIAIGSKPDAVEYQLYHTCGASAGITENLSTAEYVIGQDTNLEWYGVFKNFNNAANPLGCFVIAVTLTFGGDEQIYFSEEYCIESACGNLTLIQGCYGNLDNKISYDPNGVYFGVHDGDDAAMGDTTVVYQHKLLLRNVEVVRSAIKNVFKQGRTRNFRTEKERIYQFFAELVPEWYIDEIDAVFNRGEVYVGGTKYLLSETQFEKIEDCKRAWKPTATFKESHFQSFSCEANPCLPPEQTCCEVLGVVASIEDNEVTLQFGLCEPAPTNGYNVQWRVAGSDLPYTDAGMFTESPAVFTGSGGEDYEGIIRSDCGEVFGVEKTWTTLSQSEESGSENTVWWQNGNGGNLVINVNGLEVVNTNATTSNIFQIQTGDVIEVNHDISSQGVFGEVGSTLEITNSTDVATLFNNNGSITPYPVVSFTWTAIVGKNYLVSAGVVGF